MMLKYVRRGAGISIFLLAAGCGSDAATSGEAGPLGSGPSDSTKCPASIPSGACQNTMLVCDYPAGSDGCPARMECISYGGFPADGSWTAYIPGAGGSCTEPGKICEYAEGLEGTPRYGALRCSDSQKWEVYDLCPSMAPQEATACTHSEIRCNYGKCPGIEAPVVGADCYPNGDKLAWHLTTFCSPADGGP